MSTLGIPLAKNIQTYNLSDESLITCTEPVPFRKGTGTLPQDYHWAKIDSQSTILAPEDDIPTIGWKILNGIASYTTLWPLENGDIPDLSNFDAGVCPIIITQSLIDNHAIGKPSTGIFTYTGVYSECTSFTFSTGMGAYTWADNVDNKLLTYIGGGLFRNTVETSYSFTVMWPLIDIPQSEKNWYINNRGFVDIPLTYVNNTITVEYHCSNFTIYNNAPINVCASNAPTYMLPICSPYLYAVGNGFYSNNRWAYNINQRINNNIPYSGSLSQYIYACDTSDCANPILKYTWNMVGNDNNYNGFSYSHIRIPEDAVLAVCPCSTLDIINTNVTSNFTVTY